MNEYELWFTLSPILVCLMVTACWLLFRHKPAFSFAEYQQPAKCHWLDLLIVLLCFIGIFLFPSRIRALFLNTKEAKFGYANALCAFAVALSLFRLRRWTLIELVCFCLWCLLLIPMAFSNEPLKDYTKVVSIVQSLLPLVLVLYPMKPSSREKTSKLFLILFDLFIAVLLVSGFVEHFTDRTIIRSMIELLETNGLSTDAFRRMLQDDRFFSFWGHPLTNAVLFNSFFIVNVIWLRANHRYCPTFVFFLITLAGILLTSSKTGITVCFLLQIIMNWKYKKWLLISIPVLAILYFLGAFDAIIRRFTTLPLTTGRLEALQKYISSGLDPFFFFSGYGSNVILNSSHSLYRLKPAFEFPLLMFGHDYGILFSLVHIFGLFSYVTWRFLRNKNWLPWLCWSLLFAEVNTFNAYTLRTQDDCWFFCLLTLVLLAIADQTGIKMHAAEEKTA